MSPKLTPPCPMHQDWTTAKFWGFIRAALRSAYRRWPPKFEVLLSARRELKVKKGNQRYEYKCSVCNKWHKKSEVEIDHIIPAGKLGKWDDLPGFCERMFVSTEGLRCVCKGCHRVITQLEREKS